MLVKVHELTHRRGLLEDFEWTRARRLLILSGGTKTLSPESASFGCLVSFSSWYRFLGCINTQPRHGFHELTAAPQGRHRSPLDASCGSTLSTSRVHSSTSHPSILAKTGEPPPPSCSKRVLPVLHHPPLPERPSKSFRLVALSPPQFFSYSWFVHLVCPFRFHGSCFFGTIHYTVVLPTSRAEDCASIVTCALSLPVSPIRYCAMPFINSTVTGPNAVPCA